MLTIHVQEDVIFHLKERSFCAVILSISILHIGKKVMDVR